MISLVLVESRLQHPCALSQNCYSSLSTRPPAQQFTSPSVRQSVNAKSHMTILVIQMILVILMILKVQMIQLFSVVVVQA